MIPAPPVLVILVAFTVWCAMRATWDAVEDERGQVSEYYREVIEETTRERVADGQDGRDGADGADGADGWQPTVMDRVRGTYLATRGLRGKFRDMSARSGEPGGTVRRVARAGWDGARAGWRHVWQMHKSGERAAWPDTAFCDGCRGLFHRAALMRDPADRKRRLCLVCMDLAVRGIRNPAGPDGQRIWVTEPVHADQPAPDTPAITMCPGELPAAWPEQPASPAAPAAGTVSSGGGPALALAAPPATTTIALPAEPSGDDAMPSTAVTRSYWGPARKARSVVPRGSDTATHGQWGRLMERLDDAMQTIHDRIENGNALLAQMNPGETQAREFHEYLNALREFLTRLRKYVQDVHSREMPIANATDDLGGPRERCDTAYHDRG
jgi:hypothetical protein